MQTAEFSAARPSRCARGSIRRNWRPTDLTASDVYAALASERLYFRGRQHQGSNDPGDPDLHHQPASLEEFRESRRQAGQWRQHPLERCGRGQRWAPTATRRGSPSTARTGVFIGIQIAPTANLLTVIKGVQGRCFPKSSRSCRRAWTASIAYDSTDFVNCVHPRSGGDAGRGADHRDAGHFRLSGLAALGADPRDRDSALPGGHARRSCWRSDFRSIC